MITLYVLVVLFKGATAGGPNPSGETRPQGINCRGSSQCSSLFNTVRSDNLIFAFNYTIWKRISDDAYFFEDQQIACAKNAGWAVGGICLFVQGNITSQGIKGHVLKDRISDLAYHGCEYCGSVPISGDNDPDKAGLLTANYVVHPICNGICFFGEIIRQAGEPSTSVFLNQTSSTRSLPHTTSVFTVQPGQPVHPGQPVRPGQPVHPGQPVRPGQPLPKPLTTSAP